MWWTVVFSSRSVLFKGASSGRVFGEKMIAARRVDGGRIGDDLRWLAAPRQIRRLYLWSLGAAESAFLFHDVFFMVLIFVNQAKRRSPEAQPPLFRWRSLLPKCGRLLVVQEVAKSGGGKAAKRSKSKTKTRKNRKQKGSKTKSAKSRSSKRSARTSRKKARDKRNKQKKKSQKKKKSKKKKSKSKKGRKKGQGEGDDGDDDGGGEIDLDLDLPDFKLNPVKNWKKQLKQRALQKAAHRFKMTLEGRRGDAKLAVVEAGLPEQRMAMFVDVDQPTDPSAGPFQSNRYGAIFLLPGE